MSTREVQGVTTAAEPGSRDRDHRMRVYLGQMLVRTLCFVAALFTHGWVQLACIAGAVILPYIAVVSVNNRGPQRAGTLRPVDTGAAALPATATPTDTAQEPVVLSGVVVDDAGTSPRALPAGRTR